MQIKKKVNEKRFMWLLTKVSAIPDQNVGANLEIRLIDFTHTKVKLLLFFFLFFFVLVFFLFFRLSSSLSFHLAVKNLQATILFVNFTKAFDSIHRGNME